MTFDVVGVMVCKWRPLGGDGRVYALFGLLAILYTGSRGGTLSRQFFQLIKVFKDYINNGGAIFVQEWEGTIRGCFQFFILSRERSTTRRCGTSSVWGL